MNKFISTREAAKKLKLSVTRVLTFIKSGRLPAERVGRDWLINPADLDSLVIYHRGRPHKIPE